MRHQMITNVICTYQARRGRLRAFIHAFIRAFICACVHSMPFVYAKDATINDFVASKKSFNDNLHLLVLEVICLRHAKKTVLSRPSSSTSNSTCLQVWISPQATAKRASMTPFTCLFFKPCVSATDATT